MITPIRGRKRRTKKSNLKRTLVELKDDNPDKGTETVFLFLLQVDLNPLKDDNPDKGTETQKTHIYVVSLLSLR